MHRVSGYLAVGLLVAGAGVCFGQTTQQAGMQLVQRQAQAWEKHDPSLAVGDWLPGSVLSSPEGDTRVSEIPASMKSYFQDFGDLHITIKNVFVSADGNKMAVEWDWRMTRKKDAKHEISHDAIVVDLKGGKIASWREYYDPAASGEAKN